MKKLFSVVLASFLLNAPLAHAAGAPDGRLALARSIWGPAFDQIKYEDVKARYLEDRKKAGAKGPGAEPKREDFDLARKLVLETLAEVLSEEDLQLQKRMLATAVGQRMLANIPRAFSGLPPQPLTRENFTDAEWQEWQKLSTDEKPKLVILSQHMRELAPVFDRKVQEIEAKRPKAH